MNISSANRALITAVLLALILPHSALTAPALPGPAPAAVTPPAAPAAITHPGLPGPPPAAPAAASKTAATIDADDWQHDLASGWGSGHNFRYTETDTVITGANVRYNEKKRILDADGSLVLDDPDHHAIGEKAHVDNRAKLAVITGNVVLTMKPKPGTAPPVTKDKSADETSADNRHRGATVNCDRIEDYYKRKFAVLRGHLVFHQTFKNAEDKTVERTITAEHAEYDGNHDTLLLFHPVDAHDTDNNEFHFDGEVTVGTKEGAETLQSTGRVHTKIKIDENE